MNKTLLIAGVFLVLMIKSGLALDAQSASLFYSAEEHYRQGQYEEALKSYESILSSGKESGNIFYNLGNTYYKLGDLGRSVVYYRKALELLPRDSDLKFNYQYVMARLNASQIEPSNFLEKLFSKHNQFYTLDEMLVVMFVSTVLGLCVFLAGFYFQWPRPKYRVVAAFILAISFVYVASFCIKINQNKNLAVIVRQTSAGFEPSEKATAYFQLTEGDEVLVLRRESGWSKIKRSDGKMGWVPDDSLERI